MFFVEMTSMAATEGAEVHKLLSVLLKFSQRVSRDLGQEFLTRYPALRGKISGIHINTFLGSGARNLIQFGTGSQLFHTVNFEKMVKKEQFILFS